MNPNRVSTTVPTEGWFSNLRSRGLNPVLVSRDCGDFHHWCIEQEIPAYQNDLPFPDKYRPLKFFKSLWKLRKIIKEHRIDLIHCNEQDIYPIGQYLSRLCQIPVVVSVHFTLRHGYSQWAFAGKKQPDRIFFISQGNLEASRPAVEGVIDESRWRLLPNGLDLTRFQPDQQLRESFRNELELDGTIAVGVACALRERKQLEHLSQVIARIPDDRIRVVIAGGPVSDESEYAERLLTTIQQELGARVHLLGHVTDLRPFYNGIDIFLNTSREEACSISVIESLASGCPVLGYPSKSVHTQILPDGGEIVEQDDLVQLEQAIRRWIADSDGFPECRRRANLQSKRFDIRTISDQLWEEYQSVLGSISKVTKQEFQYT